MKTPLYTIVVLALVLALTACSETMPRKDSQRQYIRAPDGWGGKYCLQNPTEC